MLFRWKRKPKLPQNNSRGGNVSEAQQIFEASRDVIERARAGDQVAMAIIAEVRDNAKRGDPRSKYTAEVMRRYIDENPPINFGVCDVTHFPALARLWGLEQEPSPEAAARVFIEHVEKVKPGQAIVALVHGPGGDSLVSAVEQLLPNNEEKTAFSHGVQSATKRLPMPKDAPKAWSLGRIFGISRAIRRLADESFPISMFCPACAWELGE